jgi:uncharacterized membrane protein YeiB
MAGAVPAAFERFAPAAPEERNAVLDILRAFALCGILDINMSASAQPIALRHAGEAWGRTPADKAVEFIKRVMWRGLGIGAVCTFGFAAGMMVADRSRPTWGGFFAGMLYSFARPAFCMFYATGLTLLAMRPQWQRRFRALALTGSMPLTNYPMQPAIATWIFYSHGLRQFGKIGPAGTLLISIGIFAVQALYSSWWMARRRYGPMEWVWRRLTYGKTPAMRLAGA